MIALKTHVQLWCSRLLHRKIWPMYRLYEMSVDHELTDLALILLKRQNVCKLILQTFCGSSKESDPPDASANTSANLLVDTSPPHYQHVGRHTTDTSLDTLSMRRPRRPTLYRRVGRNTMLFWLLFYFFQLKKARTTSLERKKAW